MRNYGLVGLIVVIVLLSCLGLIFVIIKMGDKHLTNASASILETTRKFSETVLLIKKEHREEREKWYEQYNRIGDLNDRASQYNRDEHSKIMGILSNVENVLKSVRQ